MTKSPIAFPLLAVLTISGLSAQAPFPAELLRSAPEVPSPEPAVALGAGQLRVPIHTRAPEAGRRAYGTWAAGDSYKVSFHDGFEFFPCLGADFAENLPWRWRTAAITVGGEALTGVAAPMHRHSEWRYEYDHGAVLEAYDVRPEGVEQTFVIAERPPAVGDLVVVGRIESPLVAPAVTAAQQELVFRDAAGTAIVNYGKAIAVDALGRTTPVTTAYDGDAVRLTVGGEWLALATFPVTIDPLTSPIALIAREAIENIGVHRHDEPGAHNTLLVYSRIVSAGDRDLYAFLVSPDLRTGARVFVDLSAAWSSLLPDVTFVGGADRWVVSFWEHSPLGNVARAYFHDRDSLIFNSGVATTHEPADEHVTFSALGGRSNPNTGTTALLAYRSDPFFGNSNSSKVFGVTLDAVSRSFGQRTLLSSGVVDAEAPDVNCQIGWGDDGWVVVFQGRASPIDPYHIHAVRVSERTFAATPVVQIGPRALGDKVRPVVQGWDGRYVVAFLQDVTVEINGQHFARNVLGFRIDWPTLGSTPSARPHHVLGVSAAQTLTHLGLAYDGTSRSHWCATWDDTASGVHLRRLGYQGGVTESLSFGAGTYHAAATWNGVANEFALVNANTDPTRSLEGRRLTYPTGSWHLVYGIGCGPGTITADTAPLPGSEFYRVDLQNAPPGMPGALWFSTNAGFVDLGPIGAANCASNLGAILAAVPVVVDAGGGASFTMALPNVPLVTGDMYWQYAYVWPAAPTPLTIGTTRGLRASVR